MKKLMIALAAGATTMFSFGDVSELPHGADFENANYVGGENFTNYVNKADDGATASGNRYWYSTSDDIGVISNHAAALDVPVPDLYKDATPKGGDNFLQLDTTAPLFRKAVSNNKGGAPGEQDYVSMSEGDGVYLDTLVKFTAADEPFGTNSLEEAVDKIAIEYVEREIEYGTGDEATVVKVTPLTNFVVRAGFIGSAFATNYVVALPTDWVENNKKDKWHRLTVRALTNIDGNNRAGFKIYLDEEPLVYLTDNDEFAQSAGFEDSTHMIFPSAVATGDNRTTISAVAFSGNGSIDDVVFTTTKPKFIAESEAVVVPFVADAGVTAISVLPDGATDAILVDMTADTLSAQLPAQTTAFTVTATIDTANGYTFGGITVGETAYDTNPASVTGYAGDAITITTVRNNFNLFDENGDPIQGTFQTLSKALAKEGVAKIVLAHDYDVAESEGGGFVTYNIDNDITLDLNGNTITAVDTQEEVLFTVNAGTTLVVIDSVGGGTIDYDTEYGVFGGEGDTVVGATSGDFGPTIIGPLLDTEEDPFVLVVRAKLDGEGNSDTEDSFAFEDYIAKGSDVSDELVGGYWVVTPGAIGTYTVTVTPTANATYAAAYKDGGATITPENDVLTVTVGQTIVITATPAANYEYAETPDGWTAGQDGEITIEVSAAGTVAIPAPSEKVLGTYQVTVTPTANATYAAAYKVGGETITPANDVLTVTVGQTIVITATPAANYEYATTPTGWAAGQDGEITIEVSEAGTVAIPAPTEKGGKTYPSYIDDAEEKTKYDTWAAYAEISAADFPDATGSNQEAYLLNCKPSEVADAKAAFKFTSISYDTTQSKWVTATTTSYNERGYNGEVVVKQYSDVGCTTESSTGTFFKAFLQ